MEQHQKQTRDEKIKELTEKLEEGIKSVFASVNTRNTSPSCLSSIPTASTILF